MTSANNRQVSGDHYAATTQHWDIVNEHNLDYFQGQITKYVMRWKKKNGIEDLKKAQHFLEKYIELQVEECRNNDYKLREAEEDCGPGAGYVNQD